MKFNWLRPSLANEVRAARACFKSVLSTTMSEASRGRQLRRATAGKAELCLNFGCGPQIFDNWINIDGYFQGPEVFYHNAANPLPIDDDVVARIHCEHFLEHLEFDQALKFLSECCRILMSSGTMRIIVPDAEKYMKSYASGNSEFFENLKFLGNASRPLETPAMVCNQMFRMGGDHRFGWDFETLAMISKRAGFSRVERSAWQQGPAEYQIDGMDEWRPLESLYCELWT